MNSSNTTNDDDGFSPPMRWAARRLLIAAVLVALIIAGLVFGIYSILNNSSVSAPSIKGSNHSLSTKAPSTAKTTSNSNVAQQNQNQTSTTTTQQSQLINTGPGSSILVGFFAFSVLGTVMHYTWRRNTVKR